MLIKAKTLILVFLILLISLTFTLLSSAQEGKRGYWREKLRSRKSTEEVSGPSNIQPTPLLDTPGKKVKHIKTITNDGGRVDWLPVNNLIAFDRLNKNEYYDVWVMNPEGANQECLTCAKFELSQKHNGNPAWHPSGKWIVFQSADPNLIPGGLADSKLKMLTNPGSGRLNNLWLMDVHSGRFNQLTHVGPAGGVLHPHFSHDGKKLFWAERLGKGEGTWGEWALKVADFVMDGDTARLENIQTFQPACQKRRFYESHGFSSDDTKIIFSGNPEANQREAGLDIYAFDLVSFKLTNLTKTPNEWDEHAVLSPDGGKIVWMSSQGIKNPNFSMVKTDYWIMNSDGSNKKRLTYFNDPAAPEYISIPGGICAARASFSPDGKSLLAYIKTDRRNNSGPILMIELE